jgi:hypothetical protein
MGYRRIARRRVLQGGLAGIAALSPVSLPFIGARKAMADTAPDTFRMPAAGTSTFWR